MKIDRHIRMDDLAILNMDANFAGQLEKLQKKSAEKHGGYVRMVLSVPEKPRTTGEKSQNHHLNGHIQFICQETGNDFSDVKKYVKQAAIPMGYPIKQNDKGDDVLDMYGNPVGISEADCNTTECALLIEAVHMVAAELGIILPEED